MSNDLSGMIYYVKGKATASQACGDDLTSVVADIRDTQ